MKLQTVPTSAIFIQDALKNNIFYSSPENDKACPISNSSSEPLMHSYL
jgi:hypothetical protein